MWMFNTPGKWLKNHVRLRTLLRRCNLSRTHRVCAKIGTEGRILSFIKTSQNDQRKNILKLNVFRQIWATNFFLHFPIRDRDYLNERYMACNMTNKKKMYSLGFVKKWWNISLKNVEIYKIYFFFNFFEKTYFLMTEKELNGKFLRHIFLEIYGAEEMVRNHRWLF